jgi:hypothetical protein
MADPEAMFDMRLGLAFGDMSLMRVKALPYPLYKRWMTFYALEPWGFQDREFQFAALRAEVHNTKVTKRAQLKSAKHFMRDMPKEVIKYLNKKLDRIKMESEIDLSTPEGRAQATARVVQAFTSIFGKRIVRKDE